MGASFLPVQGTWSREQDGPGSPCSLVPVPCPFRYFGRVWPLPRTIHLYVVISRRPTGPRAMAFWVESMISAPRPNWGPPGGGGLGGDALQRFVQAAHRLHGGYQRKELPAEVVRGGRRELDLRDLLRLQDAQRPPVAARLNAGRPPAAADGRQG